MGEAGAGAINNMKKIYVMPKETVIEMGLEGQLLADSNTGAGGYDNGTDGEGDGMDEDNPVKSQRIMDKQW